MSRDDVFGAVSAHVPCAHMAWPAGKAPGLPWAVFYEERSDDFFADDAAYAGASRWRVELYERYGDGALEDALAESLEGLFGPVDRVESWVGSEQCLMTAFSFKDFGFHGEGEQDG